MGSLTSLTLITTLLPHFTNEVICNLRLETQNQEYEGATFNLSNFTYRSRLAKKTSTKKGYFVVFWEKDSHQKNHPYLFDDSPDKLIITIIDGKNKGQFIFPKQRLLEKGILKTENSKGKMGIRVYPTWEKELNKTANKTQDWQKDYFIDLSAKFDYSFLKKLYF
ncbi:MepB family protein [Vagococcus sp.]|uniref:MepB family protein n=1 Tax=Vagococcus sp. TaxID=1933889 RepID=UPI003F987231